MSYLTELKKHLSTAKGIAFDNCHKIYVLMDDEQVKVMRGYGYAPLYTSKNMTTEAMYQTVREWYDDSCGLRFISAVSTGENDEPVFYSIKEQL